MYNTVKIKNIRLNNGKSQKEIATLLNVSRSSYAMWESNNNIFPIKRLIDFCDVFNISLDYIFDFNNIEYNIITKFDKIKYSSRLKELRKENKLTQEKIANFLHIDQPTWSIYENGNSIIGTPFLYMICKKYNISADYLLGRIDSPKYFK